MGLNVTNYVLQMKGDKSIASGFDHATRTGDNTFSIYFIDGSKVDLTIPLPKDGKDAVDITDVKDLGNGKFTLVLSDGSETSAVQTIKGQKGDKGDKLTFNDLTDAEKASLKGEPGFSPTITENADNTDKIYRLDITTADSTFTTPNLRGKDGQGGTGGSGEENTIESISVNGVNVTPDENKNVDITVPDAYDDTDIRTELANKADTDHTHTTVNGHTVESDVPVDAKFTDTVYDDTQVKTQIQTVANGLMDSVGYSADYKTIDIIAKNGVKKSVNVAPIISHASITELSDVDTTNKATGKALVYNATTSKHEYADVSGTDEKVKMDASTDAKYLGELLDNVTIANENGELKVKKLDGQEVTITEINYLKGLTMNVMDLVNMFSNGGVKIINTPVATYAELLTLDKSSFIEGISYLVYVLADETHDNAKTTYLVDKDSETPTYFGFADSQRDFTTNPINLATEITGKLGIANMDSDAIKALFTVDDTYKTETATNNAFSTHGAKALYDELLLAIGNKANSSDLTAHKDDTDIHVSTEDRTNWDSAKTHADSAHAPSNAQENVLETVKVNGTALEVSDKAVNVTVPTKVSELTDSADYAKTTDIPTTLPANGGNADTVNNHTVDSDVPVDAKFTDTVYDDTKIKYGEIAGGKNLFNGKYIQSVLASEVDYTNRNLYNEFPSVSDITGLKYLIFGCYLKKGTYTFSYTNDAWFSLNRFAIAGTNCYASGGEQVRKSYTWTQNVDGWTYFGIEGDDSETGTTDTPFSITPDIQIEEGTQSTPYEPYIPSVKMLAEEVGKQNDSLSVIGKCKNLLNPTLETTTVSGVTCTNNGDGTYTLNGTCTKDDAFILKNNIKINGSYRLVGCPKGEYSLWITSGYPEWVIIGEDTGNGSNFTNSSDFLFDVRINIYENRTYNNVVFKPMLTTNLSATYDDFVPYTGDGETLTHDVAKLNENLGVIGKCKNLLNPTLQTTTMNNVTCTNNGDGTYTINGTASADAVFELESYKPYTGKEKFRLVGCPNGGGESKYYLAFRPNNAEENRKDIGSGVTFNDLSTSNKYAVAIIVLNGTTVTNLTFKPMLTENLNATYDDFVPYTGDGETLTHDVAEIKNDLSVKKFELVAGVLWLCVSGKHCVLTLNGYNLTEPTHFDKLEEYQPYLVARNVVSNGDSVCIAAVEPNGNINASDLVVGTSLTGQLFGEISWIANI